MKSLKSNLTGKLKDFGMPKFTEVKSKSNYNSMLQLENMFLMHKRGNFYVLADTISS